VTTPGVTTPDVTTSGVTTPGVTTPGVTTPDVTTPGVIRIWGRHVIVLTAGAYPASRSHKDGNR